MENEKLIDHIFNLFCNQKDTKDKGVLESLYHVAGQFDFDIANLSRSNYEHVFEKRCQDAKIDHADSKCEDLRNNRIVGFHE